MCIYPWINENDFSWDIGRVPIQHDEITTNDYNEEDSTPKNIFQINSNRKIIEFIQINKATVIYHPKESEICQKKEWNAFNHFHIIWNSETRPGENQRLKYLRSLYKKGTQLARHIPECQRVKFPSSIANYFCQLPRYLLIKGLGTINAEFAEWCTNEYIPKSSLIPKPTTSREISDEPTFKSKSGTTLTLFNYLTYIFTSKKFRSEQDMKSHWLNRSNNDNFMRAISHPMYDSVMKKVLECVKLKTLMMPFKEKFETMNWDQFNPNKSKIWMDKECSLKIFKSILMTQGIEEQVFVKTVWDLLNKTKPKTNLLVLTGLPNTGKSMIARSIADLFTHVSTIQGTSSFPFQNLINVELGLIEEPNFSLESLQTFKKLAEGTDTEVSVKFRQDQVVHRTPLIITSNNKFDKNAPLEEKIAFITRYNEFLFYSRSPFLQYVKRKLNPIIWNYLFYEHCFNDLIYDDGFSSDDNIVNITEEYERLRDEQGKKRRDRCETPSPNRSGDTVRLEANSDSDKENFEQYTPKWRKYRKMMQSSQTAPSPEPFEEKL